MDDLRLLIEAKDPCKVERCLTRFVLKVFGLARMAAIRSLEYTGSFLELCLHLLITMLALQFGVDVVCEEFDLLVATTEELDAFLLALLNLLWCGLVQLTCGSTFRAKHVVIRLCFGFATFIFAIDIWAFCVNVIAPLVLLDAWGYLWVRFRSQLTLLEVTGEFGRQLFVLIVKSKCLDILHWNAHHLYWVVNHTCNLVCINAVDVRFSFVGLLTWSFWILATASPCTLLSVVIMALPVTFLSVLGSGTSLSKWLWSHGVARRPTILKSDFQIIQILNGSRLLGIWGQCLTRLHFSCICLTVYIRRMLLL